jgi:hypothetical protein
MQWILTAVNLGFLDRSRYFFIQVVPQLSSRGWVDPVPDTLLLRKSGRFVNRTRDLGICSQKLWPLAHRGGPIKHRQDRTDRKKQAGQTKILYWTKKCTMLFGFRIWDYHDGGYEEWYFLGCDAVYSYRSLPTFRPNVFTLSSGSKTSNNEVRSGKQTEISSI